MRCSLSCRRLVLLVLLGDDEGRVGEPLDKGKGGDSRVSKLSKDDRAEESRDERTDPIEQVESDLRLVEGDL